MAKRLRCGYVCVSVPQKFGALMAYWAKVMCGIDHDIVAPKDMHVTLIYDERNPLPLPHKDLSKRKFHASVASVELFGDDKDVLVLKLKSGCLDTRFKELQDLGYKHSYSEFRPHITLASHGATEDEYHTAKEMLPYLRMLIPESFYLTGEKWDKVRDDWDE